MRNNNVRHQVDLEDLQHKLPFDRSLLNFNRNSNDYYVPLKRGGSKKVKYNQNFTIDDEYYLKNIIPGSDVSLAPSYLPPQIDELVLEWCIAAEQVVGAKDGDVIHEINAYPYVCKDYNIDNTGIYLSNKRNGYPIIRLEKDGLLWLGEFATYLIDDNNVFLQKHDISGVAQPLAFAATFRTNIKKEGESLFSFLAHGGTDQIKIIYYQDADVFLFFVTSNGTGNIYVIPPQYVDKFIVVDVYIDGENTTVRMNGETLDRLNSDDPQIGNEDFAENGRALFVQDAHTDFAEMLLYSNATIEATANLGDYLMNKYGI